MQGDDGDNFYVIDSGIYSVLVNQKGKMVLWYITLTYTNQNSKTEHGITLA